MVTDKAPPTVLWDFDGTLVTGPGWSMTLLRVLDSEYPGHGVTLEQIRPFLHEGFPWHNPEKPHPELSTPASWWALLESLLARVYQNIGYNMNESEKMAQLAHELILRPEGYTLFEDALPALQQLTNRGWRHIVLSNSFPELREIIDNLPVNDFIQGCISSGVIGYEKPHPEIFNIALDRAGHSGQIWMVGDSLTADIRGAEAAGIPAILVHRNTEEKVKYSAENLLEAALIIENNS